MLKIKGRFLFFRQKLIQTPRAAANSVPLPEVPQLRYQVTETTGIDAEYDFKHLPADDLICMAMV